MLIAYPQSIWSDSGRNNKKTRKQHPARRSSRAAHAQVQAPRPRQCTARHTGHIPNEGIPGGHWGRGWRRSPTHPIRLRIGCRGGLGARNSP
eukprot:scaffold14475_cov107-Isochrysis_galbana.AAC.1